ncbi:MAG: hypothetical protein ABSE49_23045 [Polyangiaceae bacterium]|jgi:hypothetical protein
MAQLQRPATLKEFLIHSLLVWRDRDTLVDGDDEEPTRQLQRPDRDRPAVMPPPRASLTSYVFDLNVVPRLITSPAFDAPTPSAFVSVPPEILALRRRPSAPRTRGRATAARVLLFALVLFAAFLTAR